MAESLQSAEAPFAADDWRKLSAWAVFHFAVGAVVQNLQAALFFAPATYGVAQSDFARYTWAIPAGIVVAVLIHASLTYAFYRYRVLGDRIQIRSGVLYRKHLELPFERVQNIRLEHPFYFRPLRLVTLKLDGAGASGEEANLAALKLSDAENLRAYITRRKSQIEPADADVHLSSLDDSAENETVCFTRTVPDLIVHGLTNNRSFLAIAGIAAFVSQADISPGDLARWLGIDFDLDVAVAGFSVVRLALLFVLSFVMVVGIIAFLSVLVSIATYYGFTIHRTDSSLTIRRGLLTRHEIHVRKSKIQTLSVKQDWIDFLVDRRNIVLEQISHRQESESQLANLHKRIVIPSVRVAETAALINEVLPDARSIDDLPFTPVAKRYFHRRWLTVSAVYLFALAALPFAPVPLSMIAPALLTIWALHVVGLYMSWKRRGLAIDGDIVVARSGTIGVEYQVFPAYKLQQVSHVQSVLMQRRNLSTIRFHTAASTVKVPYLPTEFVTQLVDFCAYQVESRGKSWT